MGLVHNTTLETTYMVQIQHRDGSWAFNDQGEWDTFSEADEYGAMLFGPDCPHRVIEVTRRVVNRTTLIIRGDEELCVNPVCGQPIRRVMGSRNGWQHVNATLDGTHIAQAV